ncbi:SH3 domain-containing protein [Candidatus Cyrtobacter comes]|uniref:SH3 domain-containing protein n=1 Tax=Candidatus Cyrtobacter comes TaxID=675776 RepID=A0ABU5L7R2_9RICK|nr:SH3 domain-containing protein [Candidatus Cyrtobacter comes]MDZ5762164.1 SH3 domain-containing protein [Candidatus Cyrtobacter comes]
MSYFIQLTAFILTSCLFYESAFSLHVPRFVTLKSNITNLRVGPGMQYPIKATYECKNMPLIVIDEQDGWIMAKDVDNKEGWVHSSGIKSARFAITTANGKISLYRLPKQNARIMSILEKGLIMQVKKCNKDWCLLYDENIKGWILKTNIWGVFKDEVFGKGLQ